MVDPLIEFTNKAGLDENSNEAMAGLMHDLHALAERERIAILVVHHTRKKGLTNDAADKARGASAIINATRVAWELTYGSKEDPEARMLGRAKSNLGPTGGVAHLHMAPWRDPNNDRIETAVLEFDEWDRETTLEWEQKRLEREGRESASTKRQREVLEHLTRIGAPILLQDLYRVFAVGDNPASERQVRYAVTKLREAGKIGEHYLTKHEAGEHGWTFTSKDIVVTALAAARKET